MKPTIKKVVKNKGGAPRKEIDFIQLDKLLGYGHTGEECADLLGVSFDTIDRRVRERFKTGFAEYFKAKNGFFRSSLRRNQIRIAFGIPSYLTTKAGYVTDDGGNRIQDGWLLKPHPGMNIWLGKQFLNQKEPEKESEQLDLPEYTDVNVLSDEEILNLYDKVFNT